MKAPLEARRIALAEGRQLEELAEMLAREGAIPLRYPLLSILDAPNATPVEEWLRDLCADRFDWVVFLTGEGVRRLLGFAARAGMTDAVIAALGRTRTVTRGPKPVRALKEINVQPTRVASVPTTAGVIDSLRTESLAGLTIGVQLYVETNPQLHDFLTAAGATMHAVLPYVYAPASDAERVVDLIEHMAAGEVDVLVFTSSPQVDRLYDVAAEKALEARLAEGWQRTRIAAVGPVIAETLRQRNARLDICPEQGFVMKNLVQQIKRAFAP